MTPMPCPCQAIHDVPDELADCIDRQGATLELDLGYDGTWLVPRVWLHAHGFPLTGMPEIAEEFGFECLAPPRAGSQ